MTMWSHQPTIFKQRHALPLAGLVGLCVAIITALFLAIAPASAATDDHTLAFQGRLLMSNGESVPDGHYNVQFKIYDGGDGSAAGDPGGTLEWTETYVNNGGSSGITVQNSYFSVNLGTNTPFGSSIDWSSSHLWLSINVAGSSSACTTFGSGACTADGEMVPMTHITASPYAMDSGKLGGKSADQFVQLGQGTQTDSSNGASLSINKTGSGNFLELTSSGTAAFTLDGSGNVNFGGSASHTITLTNAAADTNGGNLSVTAGNGGTGLGTTGGALILRAGAGGGTNGSGGNVLITGGAATGTGVPGSVGIGGGGFVPAPSDPSCYPGGALATTDCAMATATVDTYSAAFIGFTTTGHTASVPDPTNITAGRILYIIAAPNTKTFTLTVNGGTAGSLTVYPKTTLPLVWNGVDWSLASGSLSGGGIGGGQASAIQTEDSKTTSPMTLQSTPQSDDSATLSTVSQSDGTPSATPEIGSIYYDTSLGALQCYEKDGWGPCVASPDEFVSLSPEYTGAVVHGDGSGELATDMCSGTLHINDGTGTDPEVCGDKDTYNYYHWTSSLTDDQSRSIFITYTLPSNFKKFVSDSTSLLGRTDADDAKVAYQLYRSNGTDGLVACGTSMTVANGDESSWQTKHAKDTNDPANCGFKPGDNLVVRIDLHAANDANAYVSTLNFAFSTEP